MILLKLLGFLLAELGIVKTMTVSLYMFTFTDSRLSFSNLVHVPRRDPTVCLG